MVIRGNIRGNGKQLAHYLTSKQENERIQILEVAGRKNASESYLQQTMLGMSLLSELTKTTKGLYHAQINPAYTEDKKMTPETWQKATNILAKHLGLENQRRIIVLHTKKDRTHAHVVFERYDHQTGKIIPNRFSRLAQDRARKEMEQVFDQKPTPHRNKHRPKLKEALTALWQQTETGAEFIKAVHKRGYLLAEGVPRHPFMVVDEHGRSFDLVRQLKGVRIKEVRQRLKHEKLIPEKEAIELMRKREGDSNNSHTQQAQKIDSDKDARQERDKYYQTFIAFSENENQLINSNESADEQAAKKKEKLLRAANIFLENSESFTPSQGNAIQNQRNETGFQTASDFIQQSQEMLALSSQKDSERIDGNERMKQTVESFIEYSNEITIPSPIGSEEIINQTSEEQLEAFLQNESSLLENDKLARQQHLLNTAEQFFRNDVPLTQEPSEDEIKRLVDEQKAIRHRQKLNKRKRL